MSLDGILSVEQLSLTDLGEERLLHTMQTATSMHAAIAFWTQRPTDFRGELPRLLQDGRGELVVDLKLPTDLERLDKLVGLGAAVYLHLPQGYSRGRPPEPADALTWSRGESKHLMHSKLVVFDRDDGTAEVWTGSHNWTYTALGGTNIEASVVIQARQGSPFYVESRAHIDFARDASRRFRRHELDWYKLLQGEKDGDPVRVFEVFGDAVDELTRRAVFIFLRTEDSLPGAGREVIVSATEEATGEEHLYWARVLQSGQLRGGTRLADGVTLDGKRHAVHNGREMAFLEPDKNVPPGLVDSCNAWITVAIDTRLPPGSHLKPNLGAEAWQTTGELPMVQQRRMSRRDRPPMRKGRHFRTPIPYEQLAHRLDRSFATRRRQRNDDEPSRPLVNKLLLHLPEED